MFRKLLRILIQNKTKLIRVYHFKVQSGGTTSLYITCWVYCIYAHCMLGILNVGCMQLEYTYSTASYNAVGLWSPINASDMLTMLPKSVCFLPLGTILLVDLHLMVIQ